MSFEGIKDTSFLKSLVTAETCISVEKKNVQAIQAKLCTRAVVFSNSNPNSLYDKTDGWHRRLIVLDTKPVPPDRKPDRYLSEKLIAELDGIFFWALEGLRRLIENDFIFTVSDKTREIMENLKQENCNVAEFMNDAQAVQLSPESTTCSVDIYNAYVNWCQSNGLQELKQKSFYDWLYHNCESYNLSPTNKAHNGRNYVRPYVYLYGEEADKTASDVHNISIVNFDCLRRLLHRLLLDKQGVLEKSEDLPEIVLSWEFRIDFETAKAFRKSGGNYLRANQWEDITVEVRIS